MMDRAEHVRMNMEKEKQEKHTCEELEEVVRTLRSDHGCPWDREQTFQSMRSCLVEEAYEYLAAIRIYEKTGNPENMREELGDLLFQVVMSSQMAEEQGMFTMSDVVADITSKMIRRHPHVFGGQATDIHRKEQVNWDEIKKQEKVGKSWIESPLREIPMEHPALVRGPKVLKKVDALYERCLTEEETLTKLSEDIHAFAECGQHSENEKSSLLGDVLMSICNLARVWKIPLEQILQDRIENLIDEKEKL